jgi:hypothetical protein
MSKPRIWLIAMVAMAMSVSHVALAEIRTWESAPFRLAQAPVGTRVFNAVGVHTCQSKSSIGYKCEVRGQFTDCDEAGRMLPKQHCCGLGEDEGGSSIGFKMGSCTLLTFPGAPKD